VPGQQQPVARVRGRRFPFHRRTDYVVAVLIVVVTLVVWLVLWDRSDIRNTSLVTGPAQVDIPVAPSSFPPSLAEVWQQPSTATPVPVVAGPNVVTAADGAVDGRDPLTGDVRWSYTRDLPLCTVSTAWNKVLAVYHRSNCNEVTALDDTTGARGPQRNGDAQLGTQLVSDGIYVTTTGPTLLDTWRSDLVQTAEYGTVPDFVNPNVQPRVDCTYGSVVASPGLVGVLERCPGDPGDRLSVYRAAPKDSDAPEVLFSTVIGAHGSRVIAMNDQYVAVVVPGPSRVVVFNSQTGAHLTEYPVSLPASDLTGNPPGLVVPTYAGSGAVYWYTGSSTVALSNIDFHPLWSVSGTLGAGTAFVGRYLVPISNGLLVLNQATGARIGTIGVNRHGYAGPVALATLGPMVLEQRGNILAALR
jgi:hypothetical protein